MKSKQQQFNSQILDSIVNEHDLEDQKDNEFTISDLIGRGLRRGVARQFCERGILSGQLERRMGRANVTGRVCWLYHKKK